MLLPINSPKWAFWATLFFSYTIGIFAGVYIVRYHKYCFVLVGAYLGVILSIFLFNLFLYQYIPEVRFRRSLLELSCNVYGHNGNNLCNH